MNSEEKIGMFIEKLSEVTTTAFFTYFKREHVLGDIDTSDNFLANKFLRKEILDFFYKAEIPAHFTAKELLVYYKYNDKFSSEINKGYTTEVLNSLKDIFWPHLSRNEAITEEENEKVWPITADNGYLFDDSLLQVAGPKDEENIPVPLPPSFIADKNIEVISAEVWDKSFKIEFIDKTSKENYFIRFYDKKGKIIKEENKKANINGEIKTIIIDNCSYKLFTEYVWNITRD